MQTIWPIEIILIQIIQNLGSWLFPLMQFFSSLGIEEFYIVLVPLLYWCIDPAFGLRLGSMLVITSSLNGYLKQLFHSPRPYWLSKDIHAYATETSFGFPSAHAQNAASIGGLAAVEMNRKYTRSPWVWWIIGFLILGIGLSRLYLGVHFISDVLAGWLIGASLVWIFFRLEKPLLNWFLKLSFTWQAAAAFGSSAVLVGINVAIKMLSSGWSLPETWRQNAAFASPTNVLDPMNITQIFSTSGIWFGMVVGAAWLWRRDKFSVTGDPRRRILRFIIGIAGILIIRYGLGAIFPGGETPVSLVLRFVRYSLVGGWVSAFAPLVFHKLGLMHFEHPQE